MKKNENQVVESTMQKKMPTKITIEILIIYKII